MDDFNVLEMSPAELDAHLQKAADEFVYTGPADNSYQVFTAAEAV
jgi:hypothetical protein